VPFSLSEINAYDGWTWSWSDNGSNYTDIGQTISLSLSDAGNHQVQVIAYNIHGCYDTLTFNVFVYPYAELEATTQWPSVCVDYPTELNCVANGAVTPVAFHWTATPPDPTLNPNIQNPVVSPQVSTTYQCRMLDANGCYDSTTVTVNVRPRMAGTIVGAPGSACTDKQVQLTFYEIVSPQSGASYYWMFDGGTPPTSSMETPTVMWSTPGQKNIQLTITEPGCEETFELDYTVHPDPEALFSATNNTGCQPIEVSFANASQNLESPSYLWDFGDGNTSTETNPSHLYEVPGDYSVTLTVTNQTGCVNTLTMNNLVEVYAVPVADFTAEPGAATIDNPTIRFTEGIDIPYSIIDWDFGDGATNSGDASPRHTYGAAGNYTVIMYTETVHGCWDRDTLQVAILEDLKIYVPNAFTPDGDGLNDCFSVGGTTGDVIDAFQVIIYSRWGELIYDSPVDDPYCVWNGKDMSGKPVTPDSYVYRIFGKDFRGAKKVYEGVVTIVK
jgi:gliding motility-associated-like protein